MADTFRTPRERMEAFPTFAAYCAGLSPSSLAMLICDQEHQRNVFGTYPGTLYDHALMIIAAAVASRHPQLIEKHLGIAGGAFSLGDRAKKIKGSSWNGRVVGFYSTRLTPVGYVIESEREPGSCQLYPEAALAPANAAKDTDHG